MLKNKEHTYINYTCDFFAYIIDDNQAEFDIVMTGGDSYDYVFFYGRISFC